MTMTDTNELGDALELSAVSRGQLQRLRELKLQTKEIKEAMDKIIEGIKAELGGNPLGSINGVPVVSWKGNPTTRFSQALAKEKLSPEVFASCMETKPVYTFRVLEGEE